MQEYYYYFVKAIAGIHMILIFGNILSVPLLVAYTPFYIWMPMVTMLVSPVLGGTYCIFNRLENFYRFKAGMPQIDDRLAEFLNFRRK